MFHAKPQNKKLSIYIHALLRGEREGWRREDEEGNMNPSSGMQITLHKVLNYKKHFLKPLQ